MRHSFRHYSIRTSYLLSLPPHNLYPLHVLESIYYLLVVQQHIVAQHLKHTLLKPVPSIGDATAIVSWTVEELDKRPDLMLGGNQTSARSGKHFTAAGRARELASWSVSLLSPTSKARQGLKCSVVT